MSLLKWCADYSTGIDFFDQQHSNLIKIINQSQQNLIEGVAYDKAVEVLIEMAKYAQEHFCAEESFMTKISYPKIEKHHQAHQGFISRIEEATNQVDARKMDAFWIILKLNNYLNFWLINHIQGFDKEYGVYYNSHPNVQSAAIK
jgi:hemerythrin-like metal-binding protein